MCLVLANKNSNGSTAYRVTQRYRVCQVVTHTLPHSVGANRPPTLSVVCQSGSYSLRDGLEYCSAVQNVLDIAITCALHRIVPEQQG